MSSVQYLTDGAMAIQTETSAGKAGSSGKAPRQPVTPPREPLSERIVAWGKTHKRLTSWSGAIVVVAAVLFVWTASSTRRSEAIAGRQLQGARYAFESQNLPLAASELARIVENYSGTNAAAQGRLLLAQVRLQQGQPQQAVELLRDFAPGAGAAYRAQAYGLLGAAHENLGRPRDAAQAYEAGAEGARMDFLRAQLLVEAGRAWTAAGDPAKAIAAYQRVVQELPKERAVTEAKVRLGELSKGTP